MPLPIMVCSQSLIEVALAPEVKEALLKYFDAKEIIEITAAIAPPSFESGIDWDRIRAETKSEVLILCNVSDACILGIVQECKDNGLKIYELQGSKLTEVFGARLTGRWELGDLQGKIARREHLYPGLMY